MSQGVTTKWETTGASPFCRFYKVSRVCEIEIWHLDLRTNQTHFVPKFGILTPNHFFKIGHLIWFCDWPFTFLLQRVPDWLYYNEDSPLFGTPSSSLIPPKSFVSPPVSTPRPRYPGLGRSWVSAGHVRSTRHSDYDTPESVGCLWPHTKVYPLFSPSFTQFHECFHPCLPCSLHCL